MNANKMHMHVFRRWLTNNHSLVACGFALGLLLSSCNRVSHPKNLASVTIILARMAPGYSRPIYNVTIHGTGSVEYEGLQAVPVRGRRTATLSQSTVTAILQEFDRVKFMSIDQATIPVPTDSGNTFVSLAVDGKHNQIHSQYSDSSDLTEPSARFLKEYPGAETEWMFRTLAQKIDALAETDRWTKCSPLCMKLLQDYPYSNQLTLSGDTLLLRSIQEPSFALRDVQIDPQTVIETGADVNIANRWGVTPLMAAAKKGDADLIRELLAHGADPIAKDKQGKTAFGYTSDPSIRQLVTGVGPAK
jgi:hypothetical protein